MKQLIVYDLDGTLVDTQADIADAINFMLVALGTTARSRAEIRRLVGKGLRELVSGALATRDPQLIERAVRLFGEHYRAHLLDASRPYPGCLELLEHFALRRQAVLTNKPSPFAQELLAGLGISRYFIQVIAGDAAYPKKPDPSALRELMTGCGAAPDQTLLIGDSPIDIETGRRAGVFTVVVGHGFCEPAELRAAEPDLLVQDFTELLETARRLGW